MTGRKHFQIELMKMKLIDEKAIDINEECAFSEKGIETFWMRFLQPMM